MPSHHDSAHTLFIEGSDAIAFAQAQFSGNAAKLDSGQWQFSAWLDAQGRVLALFHLVRLADERLLLLLRGGDADVMAAALRRYVFRSKVKLDASASTRLSNGPALPLYEAAMDEHVVMLGCATHSLRLAMHASFEATPDDRAWRLPQLHAGWPWLPDPLLGKLLPPALSLERLQAVTFDKGCYPGQEIVARLHYRGGHKWHLHRVVLSQPLVAGSTLYANDHEVAHVLEALPANGTIDALAVIRDDVLADAAGDFFDVDGQLVHVASQQAWPA